MKSTLLTAACMATLGVTAAIAQGQQGSEGEQRPAGAQAQAAPLPGVPVTLTGCVYQASDQPAVFALRTEERADSAAGNQQPGAGNQQAGPGNQAGAEGQASGQRETSSPRATASAGQGQQEPAGTTGTAEAGAAWYRLDPGATESLARYEGQRVTVSGRLTPGRDERRADVVIHRFGPDRVTVTALDLQPAPELEIGSISPAGGSCEGAQNRGAQPQQRGQPQGAQPQPSQPRNPPSQGPGR